MISSRWNERHEISSRRGNKNQEEAAPNVLVSLNRRAGVNHQNGTGWYQDWAVMLKSKVPLTDWNH